MHKLGITYSTDDEFLRIHYEDITSTVYKADDGSLYNECEKIHIVNINKFQVKSGKFSKNYYARKVDKLKIILEGYLTKYDNIKFVFDECRFYPIHLYPSNIKKLYFSECYEFNQSLDNLPPNLKELYIEGDCFNQSFDYLPYGLEKLDICCDEYEYTLLNLPNTIKSLMLSTCFMEDNNYLLLPMNLKELKIMEDIDMNNIPDSIEHLHLLSCNKQSIYKLPLNLKKITFGSQYNIQNKVNYDIIQQLIKGYENGVECIESVYDYM